MSDENAELFRRGLDAFNRGDVDAWLETLHPDAAFAPVRSTVEGVYRGHEGIRRFLEDNNESFESFRLDYTDIRDLGDDRVLAIGTVHIRTRGSGIETDLPTAAIATVRDGLLAEWKDYGDKKLALAAAGLAE